MRLTDGIRKGLILTLTLLLVSAMLPSLAAADETAERKLPGLFALQADNALLEAGEEDPGRGMTLQERAEATYDDQGRLADPGPMVDLALERMRLAFGPDAVPIGTVDDVAGSHISGVFRFGFPAGDLDGDGQAEAFVYTIDISTYILTLEAVDGDGTSLWNRTFDLLEEDLYLLVPILPGDLDGDGGDDVLLWTLRITDSTGQYACVPFAACAYAADIDAEWGLQSLDGGDGTVLSDTRYPAFASAVAAFDTTPTPTFTYAQIVEVDNNLVYPVPLGDVDGDGGIDLVVVQDDLEFILAYTVTYPIVAFTFAYVFSVSVDSDATLVRGADGTALGGYTVARDTLDNPYVLALGDTSGDGIQDLAVLTLEGNNVFGAACAWTLIAGHCVGTPGVYNAILSVRSALDGSTHWEDEAFDAWHLALPGDVNGDGADDIALADFDRLSVVSGATGDPISSASFPDIDLLFAPGDLDGDGRGDLLVGDARYDWNGTRTFVLSGVSGADGGILYDTTVAGIDGWFFVEDAGDQDGDGAKDLFIISIIGFFDGFGLHIVTTADGSTSWSDSYGDFAWIVDAGDLDGDGDHDAATTVTTAISYGYDWTFTGREENGGLIGSRTHSLLLDSEAIALGAQGSFDGDGTGDLLITALELVGNQILSSVEGVDVTTGAAHFSRGDTLLSPDDVDLPEQNDAGSGGDAPNGRSEALPITPGAYTGMLVPEYGDDEDWYGFNASAGQEIAVGMTPPSGSDFDLRVCFKTEYGFSCSYSFNGGDASEEIAFTAKESGAYTIGIDHWSGAGGNYTFELSLNGTGSGGDAAPSFSRLDRDRTVSGGTLRALDVRNSDTLVRVTVDGTEVPYTIEEFYASSGGDPAFHDPRIDVVFDVPALDAGFYEVRLENATGAGQNTTIEIVAPTDLAVTGVVVTGASVGAGGVAAPTGNLQVTYTIANLGTSTNFNPDGHPDRIDVTITVTPKDGTLGGHRGTQVFEHGRLAAVAPGESADLVFEINPKTRFVGEYDVTVEIAYSPSDLDDTNDSGSASFTTWVGGHGGL